MRLEQWPLPYLRVKCAQCDREGKLSMATLINRFGGDRDLFIVREKLTEPTCKRDNPQKTKCMSILPDALLVQAIKADTKEDVLKPQLIEEAANWSPKWLEDRK